MTGVDGMGLRSVRTGKAAACVACCFLLDSRAIPILGIIQSHPCRVSGEDTWDNSRRAVTPQPSLPSTEAVISPSYQTWVVDWEYANPYRTYILMHSQFPVLASSQCFTPHHLSSRLMIGFTE
ncbi:hypothetical protein IG631_24100 [Alternaria alternata]|nr:hypothetical protein IG631_24100 [Alternaria alternata]